MKNMKKRNLLLLGLFSVVFMVNAQTADSKFAIGISGIQNEYDGDYGSGIFNFKQSLYPAGGLSLSYFLTPSFDLGLQGSYGKYGYRENKVNYFRGLKTDASLFTHYKLNNGYILSKDSKLSPFISLGVGFAKYGIDASLDKSGTNKSLYPTIITKGTDFVVPVGAGLKYQITDHFAVQYQYLYNFTNADNHDENLGANYFGKKHPSRLVNDCYGQHIVSLVFNFGKPRDTDKDGIADKLDKCPDTPLNVKVDKVGCPVDTDGDGIPDYLDKCPNTPKGVQVDAKGCPLDSDGDGVPDYLDKCPNTPTGVQVDAKGCPLDADGDGVPDYMDKCPNTPTGVQVDAKGCPLDTDGDGVPDYLDKCPNTPTGVIVDINGCPLDKDGDGVPDYLDKCPDVPGIIANDGCPEIKAEVKKIFAQALQGVQFEPGKNILKKTSFGILNKVVKVLKENPTYNLEINGHTDNQGDAARNQLLSQKRADAVKGYLVNKGIKAGRLTAKGYGQQVPVADNSTVAGRAQNRRVEFKVNM